MIGGDRRDATPVVDAGVEQHTEVITEVWWCLNVNFGWQNQASRCDGPEEFILRTRRGMLHAGPQLRKEILHDHLLNVTVSGMRRRNGLERCDAVRAAFTEADEDAGCERNV